MLGLWHSVYLKTHTISKEVVRRCVLNPNMCLPVNTTRSSSLQYPPGTHQHLYKTSVTSSQSLSGTFIASYCQPAELEVHPQCILSRVPRKRAAESLRSFLVLFDSLTLPNQHNAVVISVKARPRAAFVLGAFHHSSPCRTHSQPCHAQLAPPCLVYPSSCSWKTQRHKPVF